MQKSPINRGHASRHPLPRYDFDSHDPPDRYIRRPEVEHITGLGRSQIYRLMADGRFPKPIKLSSRCAAWSLREVRAFLADRHRERDTAAEA